jgi:hypothetical protein
MVNRMNSPMVLVPYLDMQQRNLQKVFIWVNLCHHVFRCKNVLFYFLLHYYFQFRFKGFKGVLSIDSAIDQRIEWAKQNKINENSVHILFRQSQVKFTAPESKHIEIVKYSKPAMVSLNRPLIAILDQVLFDFYINCALFLLEL